MKISLIAAMANDRVIGKDNQMPWHLPADFQWFKQSTMGKPIIMGRKTYESIGRPLPGRANIVISRNPELTIEGVQCVASIEQALALVESHSEVMIIGGGSIYEACLPRADKLYLTFIDADIEGDTQFPDFNQFAWQQVHDSSYSADEKNQYDMKFVILERI